MKKTTSSANLNEAIVKEAVMRGQSRAQHPEGQYLGNGYGQFVDLLDKQEVDVPAIENRRKAIKIDSGLSKSPKRQNTRSTQSLSLGSLSEGYSTFSDDKPRDTSGIPQSLTKEKFIPETGSYLSNVSDSQSSFISRSSSVSSEQSQLSWRSRMSEQAPFEMDR